MSEALILTAVRPDEGEVVLDVDRLLATLEGDQVSGLDGELAVRAMLLQLKRDRVEAHRVRRLRDAVEAPYQHALERISVREARIREVLNDYLHRLPEGSNVRIPDAGTVYLSKRRPGGHARITDAEAFESVLDELPLSEAERRALYREQLDKTAATAALERFYATTPSGELVRRDTGEFEELPGVEVQPEETDVSIRLA